MTPGFASSTRVWTGDAPEHRVQDHDESSPGLREAAAAA